MPRLERMKKAERLQLIEDVRKLLQEGFEPKLIQKELKIRKDLFGLIFLSLYEKGKIPYSRVSVTSAANPIYKILKVSQDTYISVENISTDEFVIKIVNLTKKEEE